MLKKETRSRGTSVKGGGRLKYRVGLKQWNRQIIKCGGGGEGREGGTTTQNNNNSGVGQCKPAQRVARGFELRTAVHKGSVASSCTHTLRQTKHTHTPDGPLWINTRLFLLAELHTDQADLKWELLLNSKQLLAGVRRVFFFPSFFFAVNSRNIMPP